MTVDELIAKILGSERDFSYIKLDDHADLSGHDGFPELNKYLKKRGFSPQAFNFSYSNIAHVQACGFYLPSADLICTNLMGANLAGAFLVAADLTKADLKRANLGQAECWSTNFMEADIRNVVGLERAKYIKHAIFHNTIVTKKEENIILKVIGATDLFDVRA